MDLFDVTDEADNERLRDAGAWPLDGTDTTRWRLPDGAVVDRSEAMKWLERQGK